MSEPFDGFDDETEVEAGAPIWIAVWMVVGVCLWGALLVAILEVAQ